MIKSVCGYCGVGCGLEYDTSKLVGDIAYPTNEGLVCAKGVSELNTIETSTRLLRPKARTTLDESFKTYDWNSVIKYICSKIKKIDTNKLAFYLSGQLLTEDYYIANKLAKGFLRTNNIDTNSRTCMASAVYAYKQAFGVDYVPVRIDDLHKTDLLIVVGANIAEAHVVYFNKVKRELKRGMKLIVIDPRYTETAKHATLHLPINIGSDIDFFNLVALRLIEDQKTDPLYIKEHVEGFTQYHNKLKRQPKTKLLKRTGLTKAQFEAFMKLFYENENITTAWTMGINQSVQGVDKNLSIINLHLLTGKINKEGNGPFSLTGQPNAMGGREVGGLSTMLAVHLGFEDESIKKVEKFWNTNGIQNRPGLVATEVVDAALKGEIEILIICHTDPIYHLPNRSKVEEAFKKIPLIIEINAYNDSETSEFAHIQLPAAPWGEKEGTQTNMDRTITRQEKLTRTSIDCKPDWQIFQMIAQELGFTKAFNFKNANEIFEEYKEMTKLSPNGHLNIYDIKDSKSLVNNSFVWGENLLKENSFFTKHSKANLHFVENRLLSEKTSTEYPFMLITGRTRDQWHSGTKTAHVKRLKNYKELEFVEINPLDAQALDIEDEDYVDVSTARGTLSLKVMITDKIPRKTLFIPVSVRGVNYLTNDLLDPISKEPDYNHNAAKVVKEFYIQH